MNDRQCKDSLAFFLSECELHLTGHLNFWVKESSFLIFTSVCVFTDFLRSAWRLNKNILTGSSIRQDLKGKKITKKKKEKENHLLCEFNRNIDLEKQKVFCHVCTFFFF